MNLITLTAADGNKVLINADRIDGIRKDFNSSNTLVFVGGCVHTFHVKESTDQIESICNHNVTMNSEQEVKE